MKITKTIVVLLIIFNSCSKDRTGNNCTDPGIVPNPTYFNPVWYPNGTILGFNHVPLKSIDSSSAPCTFYYYSYYDDSSGFWLINKDGSNLRRLTSFQLLTPAWSPDGKWIAFSDGVNIYKMSFDGLTFDTTNIIQLTTKANNFYPSWNNTSDTIYYDSNEDALEGTSFYHIWKMTTDGNNKTLVTKLLNDGDIREPWYTYDNQILHSRYVRQYQQIFTMNTNGDSVKQITFQEGLYNDKRNPRYYDSKIYYESRGIWSIHEDGTEVMQLCEKSTQGFSISKDGIIAYVNFDYNKLNKTDGTIWLMNTDGSNKKQLTQNNL